MDELFKELQEAGSDNAEVAKLSHSVESTMLLNISSMLVILGKMLKQIGEGT